MLEGKKKKGLIGLMSRVFANGPGDWGSIPGRVIPKTQKMVFDAALLNTQFYKIRIKGKVVQPREWRSAFPGVVAIEKRAFWSSSTKVANFTYKVCVCVGREREKKRFVCRIVSVKK